MYFSTYYYNKASYQGVGIQEDTFRVLRQTPAV